MSNTFTDSSTPLPVKVFNWNILAQELFVPDRFATSSTDVRDPVKRTERILKVLDEPCASGSVITLQEVTCDMSAVLTMYFESRNYHYVPALYGSKKNGYMGVAAAYPRRVYDLLDVQVKCVSDVIQETQKPFEEEASRVLRCLFAVQNVFYGSHNKTENQWENAIRRKNKVIILKLRPRNTSEFGKSDTVHPYFSVLTYHMPCAFTCPRTMRLHAETLMQKIALREGPVIIAGDFNTKRSDVLYSDTLTQSFNDVHAGPHANPPDYTTWCKSDKGVTFKDTLDYILHIGFGGARHDEVKEVNGPLPSHECPSDHIPISATFDLPIEETVSSSE